MIKASIFNACERCGEGPRSRKIPDAPSRTLFPVCAAFCFTMRALKSAPRSA